MYRSIEDAPPALRERILEAVEGPNAETIYIANQEAYEQIIEKAGEAPPELRDRDTNLAGRPSSKLDHRLSRNARRAILAIFGGIAGLWALWAALIQIGK